ncbi:hypothetical protein F511_32695 [Dorcoceras hygrometricum]|uniref:Uncharacterized protein n=1 Tax=Dorcoceras hygrometricum TaxID=472368 RepID=A0A2Z7BW34_9LAMI|nr:hypothetical protein F511_32695 [Dorcoceras hygrometricum]
MLLTFLIKCAEQSAAELESISSIDQLSNQHISDQHITDQSRSTCIKSDQHNTDKIKVAQMSSIDQISAAKIKSEQYISDPSNTYIGAKLIKDKSAKVYPIGAKLIKDKSTKGYQIRAKLIKDKSAQEFRSEQSRLRTIHLGRTD